jgi:mono/diheme cytochrome c family protein
MKAIGRAFLLVFFLAGVVLSIPFYRMIEAHGPTGWAAPAKEKKVKNPIPNTAESRSRGQKIYLEKCVLCHGLKGDGQGEIGKTLDPPIPAFTDRLMMKEMTDGEIFWKITTGKGQMPSYQKELTEKERWDLVNFIRSFAKSR